MKDTPEISYQYDPEANRLFIIRNGKHIGGFMGPQAEKQFAKQVVGGSEISFITMDKEKKRKTLVRRLRATWIKQGIDKHRGHILGAYGVGSTADLSISQLEELITIYSARANKPATDKIRRLRSNALVTLTRMGIYDNQNWDKVNTFLMDKRIAGKLLYQMGENELVALNRKLRAIADKWADEKLDLNSPEMMN